MNSKRIFAALSIVILAAFITSIAYCADEDTRNILKQGLLGAGTGAIASGASGGNAGQGALIGAGTNVIGGAILDMLTTPSAPAARQAPPQYYQDDQYYDDQPVEYYEPPPQESGTQKVLKQGLLGAGTGALAAGVSGGDAGKGALIGAGTNIIGGALLDAITTPSQPQRVYRRPAPRQAQPQQTIKQDQYYEEDTGTDTGSRKKVIRKYDDTGKVISEEEIYY